MSARRKILQLAAITVLSGLVGFSVGYVSIRKGALELSGPLETIPRLEMTDLAYAFALPEQVKAMIEREPPQPVEWAPTEARVQVLRKLRLAVVAESEPERSSLLAQANALCEDCTSESIERMFQRYAQNRLVPPGNDITCDDCTPARQRKALPRAW